MRKAKKLLQCSLAGLLAVAWMLVLTPSTVMAAEVNTVDANTVEVNAVGEEITEESTELALRSIFSARYYAEQNPDLKALFGYDEEALFKHFMDYGIKEGRDVSPIVDVRAYREANRDLLERYGDDWEELIKHFVNHGVYEAADGTRSSGGVRFNPVAYLRDNPEAAEKTGGDPLKAAEYYISQNMPAGEWADPAVAVALGDAPAETTVVTNPTTVVEPTESTEGNVPEVTTPNVSNDDNQDVVVPDVDHGSSSQPSNPDPTPSVPDEPQEPDCSAGHASLGCTEACPTCGYVRGHDYLCGSCTVCGEENRGYQETCNHNYENGTCTKCGKHDDNFDNTGGNITNPSNPGGNGNVNVPDQGGDPNDKDGDLEDQNGGNGNGDGNDDVNGGNGAGNGLEVNGGGELGANEQKAA